MYNSPCLLPHLNNGCQISGLLSSFCPGHLACPVICGGGGLGVCERLCVCVCVVGGGGGVAGGCVVLWKAEDGRLGLFAQVAACRLIFQYCPGAELNMTTQERRLGVGVLGWHGDAVAHGRPTWSIWGSIGYFNPPVLSTASPDKFLATATVVLLSSCMILYTSTSLTADYGFIAYWRGNTFNAWLMITRPE